MRQLGASTTMASLALTAFWASVTLGRVLFAAIRLRFPTRRTYHLLPFVLAGLIKIGYDLALYAAYSQRPAETETGPRR